MTPDDVIRGLGVRDVDVLSHEPVMTCEAQTQSLAALGIADHDRIAKNLFLKDNRNRYFLCTALKGTVVPFSKELSIRLGLKKGELRMAPPEAMQAALGVAPGAATPLAAAAPTARRVVLILDERLREAPFYVHPLTNTQTVRVTAAQLDAFLAARGCRGHYTDLSKTDLVIGPDTPPDLRDVALSVPEEKSKGEAKGIAAGTDLKKEKKAARVAKGAVTPGDAGQPASAPADCVKSCVATLLELMTGGVQQALEQQGALSAAQVAEVARDMELEINGLRNAAYARGADATRKGVVAQVLGEWR